MDDEDRPAGQAAAAGPAGTRTRLTADDRRRQLIGIGLQLLISRPIHQLSIDEVAADAGISRSLLFHYFPSKRAYYVAVVEAGFRRMLRYTEPPRDADPAERLGHLVAGLVSFIDRRREPYVALVRGAAGGDEWIQEIIEGTRSTLVDRAVLALRDARPDAPVPDDDRLLRLSVRGWLACAEELTLAWSADAAAGRAVIDRDGLIAMLTEALDALVAVAARAAAGGPARADDRAGQSIGGPGSGIGGVSGPGGAGVVGPGTGGVGLGGDGVGTGGVGLSGPGGSEPAGGATSSRIPDSPRDAGTQ